MLRTPPMLTSLAALYRQNLLESVIPFWMNHSIDRQYGGFFTALDRDGSLYDDRKYVWLNGRQVWMLARLYNECERRPEWLEAARLGVEFLRRHAFDPQGRCYFSLTREGLPFSYQRKPYAAVFVTIGLLEYWKASGEPWAREMALDLFWKIRRWIAQPSLMGRPALAGAPPTSQLADIMVVASMALEIVAVDSDPRYQAILRQSLDAALAHCDPSRNILLENIGPPRHWPESRLFCPGHSTEVCWFLLHILKHHPDATKQARVLDILDASLHLGWDQEHGGLYYFMDIEGRPTLQLESSMKLWWPHTEAIYALICAHAISKEDRWLRWLEKVHDYTWRTFPDPEYGEWFGYADRYGKPTHTLKGNNYKGCFHVPRALWMSIQAITASSSSTPAAAASGSPASPDRL